MSAPAQQAPSARPATEVKRKLKRGELLFSEGENSRAMYLVRTGMLRIFKKKGESFIEIDTIRSGQVVGEMAFLDGNPRSAAAEALTDCEVVEIGGAAFTAVLSQLPEWLKILLKTVVGRLRAAGTRIRQLETASSALVYGDGKGESRYVFLSASDVTKSMLAVLLVGTRYGRELKPPLLERYGIQVMQIPSAKLGAMLELLAATGVLKSEVGDKETTYTLIEPEFLERLIAYLNEENMVEPSKRHDMTMRGFRIMTLIAKHLGTFATEEKTGLSIVNLMAILNAETPQGGKHPFSFDEFPELVKLGYCTELKAQSAEEALTKIDAEKFALAYRFQRVVKAIEILNDSKRKK